jgi:hypothetical protein
MTSRGKDGRLEVESVEATDSVPIILSQLKTNQKVSANFTFSQLTALMRVKAELIFTSFLVPFIELLQAYLKIVM